MVKKMVSSGSLLALFAVLGAALLAFTYDSTKERIAANEREALLRNLHELIPPDVHDNDIFNDTISVTSSEWLGSDAPVTVYRARKGGTAVAAVIAAIAPDGYNGRIKLLVAIYSSGTLGGVRVINHRETPGLGDDIEADRSDWILNFNGHSLSNPGTHGWRVKKDGGIFDQFTGATITPRAIVKAVKHSLHYFTTHRELLFAPPAESEKSQNGEADG